MADLHAARRWTIQLGRLTAARISSDEAADFVDAVAPMLAQRFPDAAFTPASLEAVAAECKYLPSYGELVAHLRVWWQQHRPLPDALPAPPIRQRDEPTAEEKAHVKWAASQAIAALRSSEQPDADRRPVARHLSPQQLDEAYRQAGVAGPRRSA